jgi:hypothetical protein
MHVRLLAVAGPFTSLRRSADRFKIWGAVFMVCAPGAAASGQVVAKLDSVVALIASGTCRPVAATAQYGVLQRQRGGSTSSTWPEEPLLSQDRLVVSGQTDVRVLIDQRLGNGTIYLTPELGRCPSAASALLARGIIVPKGSTASYRFSTERGSSTRDRLVFTVYHGSAIVNWYGGGELTVFAGDRELRPRGTVFAVMVDSATSSAAVYVIEGLVGTALQATMNAAPGQALRFRGPNVTIVPDVQPALFDEVEHHRETVWIRGGTGSSLWKTLGKVAVVGAAASGTWYVCCRPGKTKTFPVAIVITLPIF